MEEEGSDVPLQRKQTGGSRGKRLVKPRRQAPTVVVEGEPSVAVPPLVPLIVEPSVAEPTTGEVAPDLGKISFVFVIYLLCVPDRLLSAS